VEHLDSYRPSLKTDIQNLTYILSAVIDDRCLPDQKLRLEMLTESQITAGEHTNRSLEALFEFTDECSYFVAESTSQFIAEDSHCPPASLEEQVNDCTSFPHKIRLVEEP
jgi:hypothetical protein